jgi:hypothetical protein
LFFSHVQGRGVRKGPWKASKLGGRGWELFNLDNDPGETRDVSGEQPDVLNSLVRELTEWRRTVDAEREQRGAVRSGAEQIGAGGSGE